MLLRGGKMFWKYIENVGLVRVVKKAKPASIKAREEFTKKFFGSPFPIGFTKKVSKISLKTVIQRINGLGFN